MTREQFIEKLIDKYNWIKLGMTYFGSPYGDPRKWTIYINIEIDIKIHPLPSGLEVISPKNNLFPMLNYKTGLKIRRYCYEEVSAGDFPVNARELTDKMKPFATNITDDFFVIPPKETTDDLDRFRDLEF